MNINNKAIAEIADRSPTAEAFFTYAACRTRNVRDGISRIPAIKAQMAQEGFHPVPQDLLSMFKDLERAGIGQLKGDTFKWHVPIKDVGEAVVEPGKTKAIHAVPAHLPKPLKTLVMYFGDGRSASINFTASLTEEDVGFLSEKILQECK